MAKFINPLSSDEKQLLCTEVEKHPALYNRQHSLYKNRQARENCWKEVQALFPEKYDVDTLQKAWRKITDTRISYQKASLKPGLGARKLENWNLRGHTAFLDTHLLVAATASVNSSYAQKRKRIEDILEDFSDSSSDDDYDDEISFSDLQAQWEQESGSMFGASNDLQNVKPLTGKARQKYMDGLDAQVRFLLMMGRDDAPRRVSQSSAYECQLDPDRGFFESLHADFMTLDDKQMKAETKVGLLGVILEAKKRARAQEIFDQASASTSASSVKLEKL